MWNDNDGQWHMMSSGGAWGMLLLTVVLIVIAGAVLVLFVRGPRQPGMVDPASRILRERLARGEIDEPEYESRLRLIERDEMQR
jgi:uncharacterized membrane protein